MQDSQCIIMLNLHKGTTLEEIIKRNEANKCLNDNNTILDGNVLIAYLSTAREVTMLLEANPYTMTLKKYQELLMYKEKKYNPLTFMTRHQIYEFQIGMKNEQMLIHTDDSLVVYENNRLGDINEIARYNSTLGCLSQTGAFMAEVKKSHINIKAGIKFQNTYAIVHHAGVNSIEFSPDDQFIVTRSADKMKITEIKSMKVFLCSKPQKVEFLGNKILLMEENKIADSNDIYENNHKQISMHKGDLIYLTKDSLSTIVYTPAKGKQIKKNHANLAKIDFIWAKDFVFCLILKTIQDRIINILEGFSRDGKIIQLPLEHEVVDIKVTDWFVVVFDITNTLSFYKRESMRFKKIQSITFTNKILLSINRKGNTVVLYDYEEDNIQFYDEGNLVCKHTHQACNLIAWSHSGLYVACCSSGSGMSGIINLFDVNGKLIWKRVFNKLDGFEWRKFLDMEDESIKKRVKENYETMKLEYEKEYAEEEKMLEYINKANIGEAVKEWREFINAKKREIGNEV
ncbi:hypothetical protein TCON_1434 [Astathelohania contejeani]|uniref:Translation initiation factor beta propellor-like domain-containing protein n=1 Tax=Astathelohania contejeani TaxID=164912 RepID=A0ABQ7HZ03_9MICR|nr:hypothetical protein TCON_1434 [Thelohania contejeani]